MKITAAALLFVFVASTLAHAQATAPTAQTLQATVREVVGIVRARSSQDGPWQEVKVGQVYKEGVEFHTGVRSRVVFSIPPDQTILLDRLGVVTLLIARGAGDEVRTSLGMPYGRTEYQVEQAGLRHNADISSPGATLAVRGTKNMLLYDQGPFMPIAYASQPVRLRNANGKTVAFGRAGSRAHLGADKNSAGEQSLVETRIDPAGSFSGRTASENALLAYFAKIAPNIDITKFGVFSKLTPHTGVIGVLPIPGQLEFTLSWISFSDLDLTVISPKGEVISALKPKSKSGGLHTGDEQSIKGQGQEHVQWNNGYPQGKYTFTVTQKVGKGDSNVFIDVVRDRQTTGERLGLFQTTINSQNPTYTNTIIVGPPKAASTTASRRK